MNIKSPLRLAVDGELVLKEATRRSFLRRSLTLGGLAMLTGCSLVDEASVDTA